MSLTASPKSAPHTRRTLEEAFSTVRARPIGILPFVPAGYPDIATTAAMLVALDRAGATAIEIGFPFSDPIADGPTIQEAFTAALQKKIKVADVLQCVADVRNQIATPLIGMLSFSIIFRLGVLRFVEMAKSAGLDALIIPDLPPPEAARVCAEIRTGGLETILLVAPTTAPERRKQIAKLSTGFIYYLSVSGITGEREELPADLSGNVAALRALTDRPICVGFGISQAASRQNASGRRRWGDRWQRAGQAGHPGNR